MTDYQPKEVYNSCINIRINIIPITLITGFLGSGKTTLLKRINELDDESKQIFLINDFSINEVDAALMANEKL